MAGTNTVTTWILLSKWEQLPGDLVFSPLRLSSYSNVVITALPVPKDPAWSGQLPSIAFSPAGGLADVTNSLALYFASAARTNNNLAELADWIEISRFSGRVRYAGITNNVNF